MLSNPQNLPLIHFYERPDMVKSNRYAPSSSNSIRVGVPIYRLLDYNSKDDIRWPYNVDLKHSLLHLRKFGMGPIAQSVEQRTFNPWVDGSSPSGPTLVCNLFLKIREGEFR